MEKVLAIYPHVLDGVPQKVPSKIKLPPSLAVIVKEQRYIFKARIVDQVSQQGALRYAPLAYGAHFLSLPTVNAHKMRGYQQDGLGRFVLEAARLNCSRSEWGSLQGYLFRYHLPSCSKCYRTPLIMFLHWRGQVFITINTLTSWR